VIESSHLEALLADLEETLWAEDSVPLYDFSWTMRGMNLGLTEEEIESICQDAYTELNRRHRLQLMWFEWPILDLSAGRPAEPGTPLDFDINTTGTVDSPLLVLVPADS
jgi:hypothetical protein